MTERMPPADLRLSLEGDEPTAGAQPTGRLSVDELIRIGINGKSAAVARYDAIIWKIRSGFVIVIYGAITLVSTVLSKGRTTVPDDSWILPVTILSFSVAAFVVDAAFSRSKYRVVASRNALVRTSWYLARSRDPASGLEKNEARLLTLLEMSGERQDPETDSDVRGYLWSREALLVFVSLYASPVLLAIALGIALDR